MQENTIQEIITSLRVEGYTYFKRKNNFMDELINLLSALAAEVPENNLEGFNSIMQEMLSAMQRQDAIFLADLLEYSLPSFCSSYQNTEVVS
ncbi:MAG: hypothetical protein ACOY46_13140 [Bacillota bacterium]